MKFLLLLAAIVAVQYSAQSQAAASLITFESYTFADKFQTNYGTGKVQDGFSWGGGFEFGDPDGQNVELYYQNLKANANYSELGQKYTGTVTFNYIMLGGTSYRRANEKVSGFGSADLGAVIISPRGDFNSGDATRFAVGGRGGVRIAPSDKFSIRLHAQLMIPLQWFGGGFYFGSGGSGTSFTGGTTIVQFNLGGSVNIRFR